MSYQSSITELLNQCKPIANCTQLYQTEALLDTLLYRLLVTTELDWFFLLKRLKDRL